MIKAKELSFMNIAIFILLSFTVSAVYFLSPTHAPATKASPVFMAEEIVVGRTLARTVAVSVPVPAPKLTTALPIIPPAVVLKVMPSYPASALGKGMSGTVLLSVYVGLKGSPEKVETKVSSGVPVLDDSAIKAVSQWTFNPATQGGAALSCWYEIPVRFEVK